MSKNVLRYIILFALFILPLLFYIYLQLSTHNFGKLPVISDEVIDVSQLDKNYTFKEKVSIVVFFGDKFEKSSAEFFNLNEKIYKKFYDYNDFQLMVILPKGTEPNVESLKKDTKMLKNAEKINFVYADHKLIKVLFESFNDKKNLDDNLHTNLAYIVDKDLRIRRGKTADENNKDKLGYNLNSISEIRKEMEDDLKILLAEYRFALKKHNHRRKI